MEPLWIAIAFALGFAARQLGQPPLVGFLAAGFVLQGIGVESNEELEWVAQMGVYLLLFSIGLKVDVRSLLRPEIWGTASAHMAGTVVLFTGIFLALASLGLSLFSELDLATAALIAFAASFSSTVFAVKVLEETGETNSRHGAIAIGILIMQDILAVVFITISAAGWPSPWAFALLGLPALRPLLIRFLERAGHGELLVLLGWLLPLAGAELFDLVRLKPDLGALLIGMLLAGTAKANELSKTLGSFKDFFLVGFFLTVGLAGAPTLEALGISIALLLLLPLKIGLFLVLLTRLHLRVRTSTFSSFALANYSEFGLIVGSVCYKSGWISGEWLVAFAVALALSFLISAPLNQHAHDLYLRWRASLLPLESDRRLPGDEPVLLGDVEFMIAGMGRFGTAAYDELSRIGHAVGAIEQDSDKVREHVEAGRNVVHGDVTDEEFWERFEESRQPSVVMLTMSSCSATLDVAERLRATGDCGSLIAATALHPDQVEELERAGVEIALDFHTEAGIGFGEAVASEAQRQGRIASPASA